MRVGAGWVKNSCRCCKNCIAGNENLCEVSNHVLPPRAFPARQHCAAASE